RPAPRTAPPSDGGGPPSRPDIAAPAASSPRRSTPASPTPESAPARAAPALAAPAPAPASPGAPAPRESRQVNAEAFAPRAAVPSAGRPDQIPSSENVLFRRLGPALAVETLGPRRIVVGKEAAYR